MSSTKSVKPLAFYIAPGLRPENGAALFAHTAAFLTASGMIGGPGEPGKPVPRKLVQTVIGDRAIKWHVSQGNMARTDKGITLTDAGAVRFTTRGADPELLAAYESILTEGKTSEATVPAVKNPAFIHKIA